MQVHRREYPRALPPRSSPFLTGYSAGEAGLHAFCRAQIRIATRATRLEKSVPATRRGIARQEPACGRKPPRRLHACSAYNNATPRISRRGAVAFAGVPTGIRTNPGCGVGKHYRIAAQVGFAAAFALPALIRNRFVAHFINVADHQKYRVQSPPARGAASPYCREASAARRSLHYFSRPLPGTRQNAVPCAPCAQRAGC